MRSVSFKIVRSSSVVFFAALLGACAQVSPPQPKPFYSESKPPAAQELRWSNGRSPRSFDPAQAAAAPETDVARALFDGLTDLDPKTLAAVPAVAERWEHSPDFKTWRFFLRDDAVWSNGKPVTAHDFVAAWTRLRDLGDKAAHRDLLLNIEGLAPQDKPKLKPERAPPEAEVKKESAPPPNVEAKEIEKEKAKEPEKEAASNSTAARIDQGLLKKGVVAENDSTLRVELIRPDKEFPKLVAHPIFRPVFDGGSVLSQDPVSPDVVTNGPFKVSSFDPNQLTVDRSENYWDRGSVKLERVIFVAAASPEKALEAYREGSVDAVTNAEFSPTALKLLAPFDDFRRTPHGAINLYEFNTSHAPFDDRRVRQALAMAIQREKLTEGELEGTTRPADTFLPFGADKEMRISQDVQKARSLLDEAGFPNGDGFPTIRLLINRNDAQQRVAKAVAEMWKANLNVSTEIIVKDAAELAAIKEAGDYDAVRRGIVLPTADETASFLAMFHNEGPDRALDAAPAAFGTAENPRRTAADVALSPSPVAGGPSPAAPADKLILTEQAAIYELNAIPLYFPTSYSLVKPYVKGFDSNVFDSPSLKAVEIDENWQTK